MNKISCDMCRDLIPLVKDSVASKDSKEAVAEHVKGCESCHDLLEEGKVEKTPMMNEQRVYGKLRKQLILFSIGLILAGIVLGIGITESENVFYNVLLMPTIGGIGYFALRKRVYIVPISVFVLTYGEQFMRCASQGGFEGATWREMLMAPSFWAILYSSFSIIGVCIGFLLYIAFRREEQ